MNQKQNHLNLDYELLRRQRDWLIALIDAVTLADEYDFEMAEGLLNLCDYLLDSWSGPGDDGKRYDIFVEGRW